MHVWRREGALIWETRSLYPLNTTVLMIAIFFEAGNNNTHEYTNNWKVRH